VPDGLTLSLKKATALTAAALAFAGVAVAAERPPFADARAAALGFGPALDAGFYALGSNPAALVALPSLQFGFDHKIYPVPHVAGETAGVGVPLGDYGTLAGGFGTVRFGEVAQYDAAGRPLSTYTYHDDRVVAGYAYPFTRWLGAGGAFRYENHLVSPENAFHDMALDAGAYIRPLAAGGGLENAVGSLTVAAAGRGLVASKRDVYTDEYRRPVALSAGLMWARDIQSHRLTINFAAPLTYLDDIALGCEFTISSVFSARGCVVGTKPAAGLGVSTNLLSFDYCYQTQELGAYHYLSVSVNPGRDIRRRGQRRKQIDQWMQEGRGYFETGKYALASDRFANVLKWDPYNAAARSYWTRAKYNQYVGEGNDYIRQKDWERARRAFKAALVVEPADFLVGEYLARVDKLEEEDKERVAEEARVAALLVDAQDYKKRGNYRKAIQICEGILATHPDRKDVQAVLADARRLLAASSAKPPDETPVETPIPAEAVAAYRQASDMLARGVVGEAVRVLGGLVNEYPNYSDARAKLVEAYLYQGLDYYSKGSLNAAVRSWQRGLALDPGNEKLKRYIAKAQAEMDQIR